MSEPVDLEAATPAPVLELRGIRAGYGRIQVLHGIDLVVSRGTVVGLLGPNGSGKSTTLGVIGGQIRPTAGAVSMAGRDVTGAAPDSLARAGVCTIPEGRGIFPNLTVTENILMFTHRGIRAAEAEDVAYERFPALRERRALLAGHLSGGEQQMLALARALATNPALLLLDELSMGLAPKIIEHLYEQVKAITATGTAILLVEQFAGFVLGVADEVAIMVNGRIRSAGQPEEMVGHLSRTYLGATTTGDPV